MNKSLLSCALACALAGSSYANAATNTYTINDPQEITAFASGYDIAKIVFSLDNMDTLTADIFPYGVPGDADGDGDPDASSSTFADGPGVGISEIIRIGMVCDFENVGCNPNFTATYRNNTLTTSHPAAGVTFEVLADRYRLTIPSVTALKQAVLGYVPTSTTFGAFSFSASLVDQQVDDFVPDRDPSTGALVCEPVTLVPPVVDAPGTGTIGYWKNHPTAWPVGCDLTLPGSNTNPDVFAMNVLDAPVKGDKTVSLAKQLVAAKLNVCAGNVSSCIASTISNADAWLVNYPVFSQQKSWLGADVYQETLDDYNNGKLCAPHRD